ncbi:hypothetical protein [Armatimonas sp.]|uniref:hypothetical protein n=1 Tax=Armatimonas sp. TaxID=1872638 RepID=UPI00286C291B|nr:hypothetical protein [Armatimonas sp.]
MTIDTPQTCRLCDGTFTIRALLEAASQHWSALNVMISTSPCCKKQEELEIQTNKVIRGYVYAAGAPHFCGMEEYDAPGLALERREGRVWLLWEGTERLLESIG